MRKFFIVAAAIAAASCGGNQSNLSKDDANSVASQLSEAIAAARPEQAGAPAGSGANLLTISTNLNVTQACPGGGNLNLSGPISINCPAGIFSCTYSGTLALAANQCTTPAGVTINTPAGQPLTVTLSGSGLNFTATATGTLEVTVDGVTTTCNVDVRLSPGLRLGSVCGISLR